MSNDQREYPAELVRRAEQYATVTFLATCPGERGELDSHELDALNTVIGAGMMMLRQASALLEKPSGAPVDADGASVLRLVPSDHAPRP